MHLSGFLPHHIVFPTNSSPSSSGYRSASPVLFHTFLAVHHNLLCHLTGWVTAYIPFSGHGFFCFLLFLSSASDCDNQTQNRSSCAISRTHGTTVWQQQAYACAEAELCHSKTQLRDDILVTINLEPCFNDALDIAISTNLPTTTAMKLSILFKSPSVFPDSKLL